MRVDGAAMGVSMAGVYWGFGVAGAIGVGRFEAKFCRASGKARLGVAAPF